ncbi:MAG: chemotaxis protein CheB, partial [Alphaproteobacteria bacterium]|nr:chemotaxis protein CheB [Alphaproteobacteria bacterium]
MSAANHIPVVGVGASAGGIEAFKSFFGTMPIDTGMAFVIVTHLPSGRKSSLPEILGRYTAMPVVSATQNASLKSGHVYVCPPDRLLTVKGGKLHLTPLTPELHRFPIDKFLISLAEAQQDAAVAILLSGGGSDGTLGLRAIRDAGGLTMAQGHDGSGPNQSSMPDTAVAAGVVDLVLPVEEMGARLAAFARKQSALVT